MKALLITILILVVFIFGCKQGPQNQAENVEYDSINKEDIKDSIFPLVEIPEDTMFSKLNSGEKVYILIYSYYNSLPNKPLKKFKVFSQNKNLIYESKTDSLEYYIDQPHLGQQTVRISPIYFITDYNPLKINLSFQIEDTLQIFFPSIINYFAEKYSFNNNIFSFLDLDFNNTDTHSTILFTPKPYIEDIDSLNYLFNSILPYLDNSTSHCNEKIELIRNAFLLYLTKKNDSAFRIINAIKETDECSFNEPLFIHYFSSFL